MRDKTIPHSTQTQAAELWEQVWPLPASAQNRAGAVAASVSAAQGKDGTQIASCGISKKGSIILIHSLLMNVKGGLRFCRYDSHCGLGHWYSTERSYGTV